MTSMIAQFEPQKIEKPLFLTVLTLCCMAFIGLGVSIPNMYVPPLSTTLKAKPVDVAIKLSIQQKEEKKELKTKLLIQKKPVPAQKLAKSKHKPKPQPKRIVKAAPQKVEAKTTAPKITNRHERAAISGLLAFKDKLADMRESINSKGISLSNTAIKGKESGEFKINRNLITSQASKNSGGIETRKFSKESQRLTKQLNGALLADFETVKMDTIPQKTKQDELDPKNKGGGLIGRSQEEIRRIFDENAAPLHTLYYRALRKSPELNGAVTVELLIDPQGKTQCKIVSSEIDDQELLNKIIARIEMFNFGQQTAPTTIVTKTLNFSPAT